MAQLSIGFSLELLSVLICKRPLEIIYHGRKGDILRIITLQNCNLIGDEITLILSENIILVKLQKNVLILLKKSQFFNKALESIGTLHTYLINSSSFYLGYIYIFKQNRTAINSLACRALHTSLLLV